MIQDDNPLRKKVVTPATFYSPEWDFQILHSKKNFIKLSCLRSTAKVDK